MARSRAAHYAVFAAAIGLLIAVTTHLAPSPARAQAQVSVTFDPGQRFQTFRAWEATVNLLGTPEQQANRMAIFDSLFDDVGITRLRVGVFSGAENRTRSMQRFVGGEIDMEGWRALRYATVNDDDDPFHITWEGFDFFDLDWRMENTVLPMQERARARGQKLEVNLNYVAFTKQIKNGAYIHTNPEEYAEFVLAAFLHLQEKYGVVPDSFEVLLEPDNVKEWSPVLLGQAMAAASRRLRHAGFTPRIIAPSMANIALTLPWIDGIASVPGATDGLAEISYHRYHGGKPAQLRQVAARAAELGVETAMLELWFGKATYMLLHNDLKLANVSAWQGRAVYGHHVIGTDGSLRLEEDMRYNRLYFNAIRPGAVRIGAASSDPKAIDPLAFVAADGGMAVVLRAGAAASAQITGLPEGDYWLETAFAGGGTPEPVFFHVGPGGSFTTEIPGPGVISLRPATDGG